MITTLKSMLFHILHPVTAYKEDLLLANEAIRIIEEAKSTTANFIFYPDLAKTSIIFERARNPEVKKYFQDQRLHAYGPHNDTVIRTVIEFDKLPMQIPGFREFLLKALKTPVLHQTLKALELARDTNISEEDAMSLVSEAEILATQPQKQLSHKV